MSALQDDIAELLDDEALAKCRELVASLGGNKRPPISLRQQAEALEYLLRKCVVNEKGKGEILISLTLDASIIADLSLTALRLRKMIPHEDDIRDLVVRR